MFDSYCRFYTDTTLDKNEFLNRISAFTGGTVSCINGIITPWCFISVTNNGCHNDKKYNNGRTVHARRQLCVEAEIFNNVNEEQYISNLKGLIEHMKSFCSGIVYSCDFEKILVNTCIA